jgi:hypothetical protein
MALKVGVSILKSTNKIESSKLHIRGNNTRYENTTIHNYKYLDNVDSVVYIDTRSSMPISPSKSRDLADENNKILTEWK